MVVNKSVVVGFVTALLMAISVCAVTEPIVNYEGNMSVGFQNDCFLVDSTPYCWQQNTQDILYYNISAVDLVDTGYDFPVLLKGDEAECIWYEDDNKVYCFQYYAASTRQNFKMDLDGSNVVWLANTTGGTISGNWNSDCGLRPNTDEVWCYGSDGSYNHELWEYNITNDIWTLVGEPYSGNASTGAINYDSCDFRNNDEFYCYGGYSDDDTSDYLMKHVISTNTTTFFKGDVNTAGQDCYFINGIFYCIGGEDYFAPTIQIDTIFGFEPLTDTFVTLNTTIPIAVNYYGSFVINSVFYVIGGQYYDGSFKSSKEVYTFDWYSCTPNWSCDLWGDCSTNDTRTCYEAIDNNSCGDNYTGNYSEFGTQACDYCTPSWHCTKLQNICPPSHIKFCITVADSNNCYPQTGLPSDEFDGNYTPYEAVCGYEGLNYSTSDVRAMGVDVLSIGGLEVIQWVRVIYVIFTLGIFVTLGGRLGLEKLGVIKPKQ
jgi:hypothetical protein